ncbi:MAG TPA: ROK family protein [Acidimicrobiales bacterium]
MSGEVRLGAVGPLGEMLDTRRYTVDAHLNPEAAAQLVESYVDELTRDGVVDRIEAVGAGAPGATQIETGLIHWAPALGWRDVAFGPMLEQILGLPAVIDNDVNLALLAEARKGSAVGCREVLLVSFADGMGGALWLDGSIYRGRGAAGEVGYMVAGASSRGLSYRSFGWAEANVHDLLERECRRRGIRTDESELRSARLASDLAGGGRTMRLSADAKEEMLKLVVSLVASACALLDVEAVILRGWIKLVGTSFLGEMRRRLQKLLADPPRILTLSAINDEAVLLGAAFAAQDTLHWPPRTHVDAEERVVGADKVKRRALDKEPSAPASKLRLTDRESPASAT